MTHKLINIKYIYYGSSIVLTKGIEILVLLFAANYLSKEAYGGLEYYKKVIEVGASFFAFGFPALILSYTKSSDSKTYFYFLSILFVLLVGLVSLPVLLYFHWAFLLVPFIFYALFFTGGVTQSYFLVLRGSNQTSLYKIFVSILFYSLVITGIYYFNLSDYAFVYPAYILLPLLFLFVFYEIKHKQVFISKLKKYGHLFNKLLLSSFTLVINNFVNLMFLYTDIFIIQLLSEQSKIEIANYSFPLNIANMLLLIPLTLIQVDIEKLKKAATYIYTLNKKIVGLLLLAIIGLVLSYYVMIHHFFIKYEDTFVLFIIILAAKFFQSNSQLFGTYLLILKAFNLNLIINISVFILNLILNIFMYKAYGLNGLAFASLFSLASRYFVLRYVVARLISNKK